MFRITQYLREIAAPTPSGKPSAEPGSRAGPVVIWNLVRRCNLTCKHCYSISADKDFANELTTDEICRVMDDLAAFRVPVLILSGGEPLLRPDLFAIAAHARARRFFVGLSSNGTLIDDAMAERIAGAGFDYVGVSLDGIAGTHDRFRRKAGAFALSLAALRRLRRLGVKVGIRYTMTEDNAHDLPALLQLTADEGIDKFYFSHLNYAGRGNTHRADDARHRTTRAAMDRLFDTAWRWLADGQPKDVVSGNNDADGPYLLHWVCRRFPEAEPRVRASLERWGGNSSGVNVANIDNLGNVHPDTMWWHHTLGNVRERRFSEIWTDLRDPLLAGLKMRPRPVTGRCAACEYLAICNGNTRVRAQQTTGDPWAADPGCYLSDAEIGLASEVTE